MTSNVNRQKKVTRITTLNSEEMARSQPRINEFLSDHASKDKTRPFATTSPDAEKHQTYTLKLKKFLS